MNFREALTSVNLTLQILTLNFLRSVFHMRLITLILLFSTSCQFAFAQETERPPITVEHAPSLTEDIDIEPPVIVMEATPVCEVSAPSGSTEYEVEAWKQICSWGGFSGAIDTECVPEDLNSLSFETPRLSDRFLTEILTSQDYVAARATPTVYLECVYIPYLNLSSHTIRGSLEFSDSLIGSLDMTPILRLVVPLLGPMPTLTNQ